MGFESDRQRFLAEERIRTGRRMAADMDTPRDKTVCMLVTEAEKQEIDDLAVRLSRTRSAVLAKIVTAFVADASEGGEPARLLELFGECREAMGGNKLGFDRK